MAVTQITEAVGTHMPFPRDEYESRWAVLDAEGWTAWATTPP